jgi:hypothetical protein
MSMCRVTGAGLATAALALGLLLKAGDAGDKTGQPWKKFLPPDTYKELVGRELKTIQAAIASGDAKDATKAKVAALLIAGCTLSAKDGSEKDLEGVRAAALRLAEILGDKDKAAEAKKLADAIASGHGDPAAKHDGLNFRHYVPKEYDLMVMYMGKVKGGDGLHPDIQKLSERLQGGEEYIENLFAYLGKKALKEAKVKMGAKEIELVGYRTAVSAEVILGYMPKNKTAKRDPEVWLQTGTAMRDGALALADAAQKQDATGIQKASAAVLDSCVKCHKMFQ